MQDFIGQAAIFRALARIVKPVSRPADTYRNTAKRLPEARGVAADVLEHARRGAFLGCLGVPGLTAIFPGPVVLPLPNLVAAPSKFVRDAAVAWVTYAYLYAAPPMACQSPGLGGAPWSGRQGDCAAQKSAAYQDCASFIDGLGRGILPGTAFVLGAAALGALYGCALSLRRQVTLEAKPEAAASS